MSTKNGFDGAVVRTTRDYPAFKGCIARTDATLIRRLKRAGSIVVGETNVASTLPTSRRTPTGCTASRTTPAT
jgi:Asp-tRNA(Asn)/Glu-tRNA(Gln) amidotransferase A subunit family amidase